MNVYVVQYGAFWKLSLKQWEQLIEDVIHQPQGYVLPQSARIEKRPRFIKPNSNGNGFFISHPNHLLYAPLNWDFDDWLDAKEELEKLKNQT